MTSRPVRDGVTLGLAVGVVGVVFGVLSVAAGISVPRTCAMSALMFTGASQFAAVGVVGSGGSQVAAASAAIALCLRNALYGPVVDRWFRDESPLRRAALAHLIIDESTGVGAAQDTPRDRRRGFIAAGLGVFVFWNLGTALGAVGGGIIGDVERWGLDAVFPAAFVVLLLPHLSGRDGRKAAAVAAALAAAASLVAPVGVPMIVAALGAGVAARQPTGPADPGERES